MKHILMITAIFLLLSAKSAKAQDDSQYDTNGDDNSQYNADNTNAMFSAGLEPYGEWVNVQYGRAWRPYNISRSWRPYMYGRWMWTDNGWYWASDEPFGWATYHYGRWAYDDYYGWVWMPDNVWGPSWVEWRYNDDYVGWAPLPPFARFNIGVGITFGNRWNAPVHYWNFVPCRSFASVRINEYVQPIERSRRIYGSTRGSVVIEGSGDRVINRGVDRVFIERRGNIRINHADVVVGEHERVVGDAGRERVEVYRPRVTGGTRGSESRVAPAVRTNTDTRGNRDSRSNGDNVVPQPDQNRRGNRVDRSNGGFSVQPSNGRVQAPVYTNPRGATPPQRVEKQRTDNRRIMPAPDNNQRTQSPQRVSPRQRVQREAPRGQQRQAAPAVRPAAPRTEGRRGHDGRRP